MSCISNERFGTSEGGSGWTWDKGGIGMGGKDAGIFMIQVSKQLIVSLMNYTSRLRIQKSDMTILFCFFRISNTNQTRCWKRKSISSTRVFCLQQLFILRR